MTFFFINPAFPGYLHYKQNMMNTMIVMIFTTLELMKKAYQNPHQVSRMIYSMIPILSLKTMNCNITPIIIEKGRIPSLPYNCIIYEMSKTKPHLSLREMGLQIARAMAPSLFQKGIMFI